MAEFDVIIVGAGVVGASLAWRPAPHRRVVIVEAEEQPGYHSTGRLVSVADRKYHRLKCEDLGGKRIPTYNHIDIDLLLARLLSQRTVSSRSTLGVVKADSHSRFYGGSCCAL